MATLGDHRMSVVVEDSHDNHYLICKGAVEEIMGLFGNMFSVVGGSLFLPFLPMLPIQVLANNLLYDFSQTTIPTDEVDNEWLVKPRKWTVVIRTNKIPFIQSIASLPLILTSVAIVAIGMWLPISPLAAGMGFVPLPPLYWLLVGLMLVTYVVLTQLIKVWFSKRYAES